MLSLLVIEIIFQKVGKSTIKLGDLNVNENVLDILGPLGNPSEIKKYGTVICIGGGVGTAEILPEVRAYKKAVSGISTFWAWLMKLVSISPKINEVKVFID